MEDLLCFVSWKLLDAIDSLLLDAGPLNTHRKFGKFHI